MNKPEENQVRYCRCEATSIQAQVGQFFLEGVSTFKQATLESLADLVDCFLSFSFNSRPLALSAYPSPTSRSMALDRGVHVQPSTDSSFFSFRLPGHVNTSTVAQSKSSERISLSCYR